VNGYTKLACKLGTVWSNRRWRDTTKQSFRFSGGASSDPFGPFETQGDVACWPKADMARLRRGSAFSGRRPRTALG